MEKSICRLQLHLRNLLDAIENKFSATASQKTRNPQLRPALLYIYQCASTTKIAAAKTTINCSSSNSSPPKI
ncbi:unnamed protein product [Meloidogyne enterolobii]|uniref:Uncharacterized protein n=1 Tax=Meloidogyne enterolobii TaxID=390850 RepID=A0ACB0ZTT0_MELEN